jgi:tetratricopeptide (TPR) repeat protein
MGVHLDRAWLLFEQSRYDLAEQEIKQEFADAPDNASAHALLALCLTHRERYDEATEAARTAVGLAPALAFAHYVLALVFNDRNHLPEAEEAVQEAIRLDPEDANYYSLLSGVRYGQRRWADALAAAEQGLQIDAEHVGCNNHRAQALVKLGRQGEAGLTLETALARDPDNAFTHANRGWSLLHEGKADKALEHFYEALRLDPNLDWARAGMIEAIKARYFIYRILLLYFLWMGTLSHRAQWGILLGAYFGNQILQATARAQPNLAPWTAPLRAAYLAVVVMTWIGQPLANLVLMTSRFGRLALSRKQKWAAGVVGALVALTLAGTGCWLWFPESDRAYFLPLIFGLMLYPVVGTFGTAKGWPQVVMIVYTAAMGLVGLCTLALMVLEPPFFALPGLLFILMGFVSMFLANAMAMVHRPRH